jgi:hypothetical protein
MAKIDVSAIDGYEEMDDAGKLSALLGFDVQDEAAAGLAEQLAAKEAESAKNKAALDKALRDIAKAKKPVDGEPDAEKLLSGVKEEFDEYKTAAETKAAELQQMLDTLTLEKRVAEYSGLYASHGFSDKDQETLLGLVKSGRKESLEYDKAFVKATENAAKIRDLAAGGGVPAGGRQGDGDVMVPKTFDELVKMDTSSIAAFKAKHPELYKKLRNA